MKKKLNKQDDKKKALAYFIPPLKKCFRDNVSYAGLKGMWYQMQMNDFVTYMLAIILQLFSYKHYSSFPVHHI